MTNYAMFSSFSLMSYKAQSAMILFCCAFLVVSGCSKGPSFDIAAKRDLMELGLQILNHHSLGGKQSDLEANENSHAKSRFST